MEPFNLIIGNKAYSSWSFRPWLVLKQTGVPFTETRVPLYVPGFKQQLQHYGGAGKVPMLQHGQRIVWDSLAICEYLAELFPATALWPPEPAERALARSVSAEMHSGFTGIRSTMPFNCRAHGRQVRWSTDVDMEISRIQQIWSDCRERHKGGPWLFGSFTIADAMYIPVALRFVTYGVDLQGSAREYIATVESHPPVKEWIAAAMDEAEVVEASEVGR